MESMKFINPKAPGCNRITIIYIYIYICIPLKLRLVSIESISWFCLYTNHGESSDVVYWACS